MLQTWANWISIIAGFFTILGLSGIVTWSVFKKEKSQWATTVLSSFNYSMKTAICLILAARLGGIYVLLYSFSMVMLKGDASPLWWESDKAIFHIIPHFILSAIAIPFYLILCACIYKFSIEPIQRFIEIFRNQKKLEIIEAIYSSIVDPSKLIDVTDDVRKLVSRGKRRFRVLNDIFDGADPHKGKGKILSIKYRLDGDERSKTVTERSTMSLD